jgi:uncharacterized spore protein YtfJ
MDILEEVARARDAVTVKRVFGDPFERDGVTVIPVAKLIGGGGGGGGEITEGQGGGSGFGLLAWPVGVYVVKDGEVRFEPALDLNRAILGGQIVGLVGLLVLRSMWRARERTRRHAA